ncbi:hypothetical protein LOAG_15134 [Loa loa]|uniref:Uncharacterized protein n=1 Tax=Loa loa TaxID=7209 RepID=A0A1S0THB7_LOALO|nr:hypothetical protein LOAG_15134 [Loa loa]EFO13395.1 hypothetical protein LOAG_15134 [Loa loa]
MRNLVKRYIAQLQRCKQQTEGITEEDVEEIKQDISAFRYELLGILRNAGFDIGDADLRQETIFSFTNSIIFPFPFSEFLGYGLNLLSTSRSKKRSLMAERRLLSGVTESMSIPMPERLLNGTSDDDNEADEVHEVDRKERRFL